VEGTPYNEEKPIYDIGREVVPEIMKTQAEIMNNSSISSSGAEATLMSNPLGYLWRQSTKVLDKGSEVAYSVGSAVSEKLEETGVTENVSYYASKTAENTKYYGSAIIEKGTETVHTVSEVPIVNDIGQKSKAVLSAGFSTVSGATSVRIVYFPSAFIYF
jgi:hypothetical protein